jgi:hypothetical protein
LLDVGCKSTRVAADWRSGPFLQRDATGNVNAEDIDPAMREVEEMRVELQADNIPKSIAKGLWVESRVSAH